MHFHLSDSEKIFGKVKRGPQVLEAMSGRSGAVIHSKTKLYSTKVRDILFR
jgi:hypothetical protein